MTVVKTDEELKKKLYDPQKPEIVQKKTKGILAGKIIGGLTTVGGGIYAGINVAKYYAAESAIYDKVGYIGEENLNFLYDTKNLPEFIKGQIRQCDPNSFGEMLCTLYRNAIERVQALDGIYQGLSVLGVGAAVLAGSYLASRRARNIKEMKV